MVKKTARKAKKGKKGSRYICGCVATCEDSLLW